MLSYVVQTLAVMVAYAAAIVTVIILAVVFFYELRGDR